MAKPYTRTTQALIQTLLNNQASEVVNQHLERFRVLAQAISAIQADHKTLAEMSLTFSRSLARTPDRDMLNQLKYIILMLHCRDLAGEGENGIEMTDAELGLAFPLS
jgi:hypothetical protein